MTLQIKTQCCAVHLILYKLQRILNTAKFHILIWQKANKLAIIQCATIINACPFLSPIGCSVGMWQQSSKSAAVYQYCISFTYMTAPILTSWILSSNINKHSHNSKPQNFEYNAPSCITTWPHLNWIPAAIIHIICTLTDCHAIYEKQLGC